MTREDVQFFVFLLCLATLCCGLGISGVITALLTPPNPPRTLLGIYALICTVVLLCVAWAVYPHDSFIVQEPIAVDLESPADFTLSSEQ